MVLENRSAVAFAEAIGRYWIQPPENTHAAGGTGLDREHQLNRKQEKIQTDEDGRYWRFELRYNGNFFGDRSEREDEVGAAFVAAGCGNADKRAAGRAEFRARRLLTATEYAAKGILPALE